MKISINIREEIELNDDLIDEIIELGIDTENYGEILEFLESRIEIDIDSLELDDISVEDFELEEIQEVVNLRKED